MYHMGCRPLFESLPGTSQTSEKFPHDSSQQIRFPYRGSIRTAPVQQTGSRQSAPLTHGPQARCLADAILRLMDAIDRPWPCRIHNPWSVTFDGAVR